MKKLLFLPFLFLVLFSCTTSDYTNVWTTYEDWRNDNDQWLFEQADLRNPDGSTYYERVVPDWNPNAYVLMHWFNNREETAGNLVPLYTSTVSVIYKGELYNGEVFDSSYTLTDSLFTTTASNLISGWTIALANMHVGDSCDVIIPYQQAYYTSSSGIVLPFSVLKFSMKLVDIPYYEVKP